MLAPGCCGSSLGRGVILAFAGERRLGRPWNGKYGLSAAKGSPVACVGLAPGPEYPGPAGLNAYACKFIYFVNLQVHSHTQKHNLFGKYTAKRTKKIKM